MHVAAHVSINLKYLDICSKLFVFVMYDVLTNLIREALGSVKV